MIKDRSDTEREIQRVRKMIQGERGKIEIGSERERERERTNNTTLYRTVYGI